MKKTVVINIVGLTKRLIGEHTPFIKTFLEDGLSTTIKPILPAVTCSMQSTYLTGKLPSEHGIVGNGWYFKEEHEVKFWRQSNTLVQSEKIWDVLKKGHHDFTCANHFWWYNMYSNADYSVTPRPNYLADGRKIPDIYSHPSELRDELQTKLGTFPLFSFWGPKTSIKSSKWIADGAIRTDEIYNPTLTLIYIPHLDYNIQKYGLDFTKISKDLKEVDEIVKQLVDYYNKQDTNIILLSEYGITDVNNPIHPNRILRKKRLLNIRIERGLELLDAGASKAFAVSDHQVSHIYLNDLSLKDELVSLFKSVKGIQKVLVDNDIEKAHLNHSRCGDIVLVADKNSWFTYYYWLDDSKAPDFARMVDIHKKPGYDAVELTTNPKDVFVIPKIIFKLIKKKLGFRTLMNVIPLDATLIKGSHGRIPESKDDHPIFVTNSKKIALNEDIEATDVFSLIYRHVTNKIN
ncbi:alkaline phosphatase family protein [Confluentibacter citreus]|uniref:alkaline phosphatase family protein n=1 Tax=Confluentibacter citreus TaxID=2007307 RepID=UPI000C28E9A1|nr:nucleotide pyrophosphatase/phosphodiesterase family protein [Confluentibacter citreus]